MTSTCCPLKTCTLMIICLDRASNCWAARRVTSHVHRHGWHEFITARHERLSDLVREALAVWRGRAANVDDAGRLGRVRDEQSEVSVDGAADMTGATNDATNRQTDTHTYTRTQYDRPRTDTRRTAVSLTTSSAPAVGPRDASNLIASQLQNYRELRYPDNAHFGE